MVESPEGIGLRKWSFLQETEGKDTDGLYLMEGKTKLALITEDGKAILHLLVTTPQLWTAANEVVLTLEVGGDMPVALIRLKNALAKAVSKDDWSKVRQA
jgi:hypothetical protein